MHANEADVTVDVTEAGKLCTRKRVEADEVYWLPEKGRGL
jgi:hypothetical protein